MAAPPYEPPRSAASPSAFGRFASRVGGHSLVYILAAFTAVFAGLASVVVLTRFLQPAEYGQLAILLAWASILTVVFNIGSLQGTNAWVFGAAGEDGETADEAVGGTRARDARRALSTGFAITLAAGGLGTLAAIAIARPVADALIGDPDDGNLVVFATVGAALASVWRLAANAIRLERRPWSYLVATATQHLLTVALAVPFLMGGWGIDGVIVGVALGNAVAVAVALVFIRRSLRPAVSWTDAVEIMRRGRMLAPVVVGFYVIQIADVLLLSRFVPTSQVGLYRVAVRIGALVSYWTTSFHMAWGAMRRDPLHVAADTERGVGAVASTMATYFCLLTFGVLLTVSLFSEELVRIASPGYSDAAALVPLAATGWACHGFYVLAYRTAEFPSKRQWFVGLTVLSAVCFFLSALVWVPLLGAYGISAAVITGWSVGTVGLVWRGQRGPGPTPYDWRRMLGALALAAGYLALAKSVAPTDEYVQLGLDCMLVAAYPVGLYICGVVPRGHVAGALQAARAALADRLAYRRGQRLSAEEHGVLDALVRRGRPEAEIALKAGMDAPELHARLVAALRRWARIGEPRETDALVGAYLLMGGAFAEREAAATAMLAEGVDPIEADALGRVARAVRRASRRRWRAAAPAGTADWPPSVRASLPGD